MVPLAEPKVEIATESGMIQENMPKIRLPNVWNKKDLTETVYSCFQMHQILTTATASLMAISEGDITVR